jgi:hypothetical protein
MIVSIKPATTGRPQWRQLRATFAAVATLGLAMLAGMTSVDMFRSSETLD